MTATMNKYLVIYANELGQGDAADPLACVIRWDPIIANRLQEALGAFERAQEAAPGIQLIELVDTEAMWFHPMAGSIPERLMDALLEHETFVVDQDEDPKLYNAITEACTGDENIRTEMPRLCVTKQYLFFSAYYADTSIPLNSLTLEQGELDRYSEEFSLWEEIDCDCLDCRTERLRRYLISKGEHHVMAQHRSQMAREQWEKDNPDEDPPLSEL